jgi:hypothetical protein
MGDRGRVGSLGNIHRGHVMDNQIKAAIILGAAIVIAVCIWVYFSPYNSCVRAG